MTAENGTTINRRHLNPNLGSVRAWIPFDHWAEDDPAHSKEGNNKGDNKGDDGEVDSKERNDKEDEPESARDMWALVYCDSNDKRFKQVATAISNDKAMNINMMFITIEDYLLKKYSFSRALKNLNEELRLLPAPLVEIIAEYCENSDAFVKRFRESRRLHLSPDVHPCHFPDIYKQSSTSTVVDVVDSST